MLSSPSRRPKVAPILVILFGILAISFGSIFVRFAQAYAPSLVIAAYRLSIATVIILPVAATRKRSEISGLSKNEILFATLSGIFLSLHFATWITSLEYTSVASSVVLVSTAPLWVALLSPIALKEPLTRPVLVGMILALIGGVVVGLSDTCNVVSGRLVCPELSTLIRGEAFLGDILALVGAWMAAGYIIIGRRLREGVSLITYIFLVYGAAAILLIVFMFSAGQSPFGYPPQAYFWFIMLALVPQLLGHSSFNWALGYLSAAFVSLTLLGEPVGTIILAYFLLGEIPTPLKMIGAILILAGIYIAGRKGLSAALPDAVT